MQKRAFSSGLEAVLALIGGKRKVLILWHLTSGPRRFSDLRRMAEGLSEKMLIQGLKELVLDGMVSRHDYEEMPPHVEYALTEFGASFAEVLRTLSDWGSLHMQRLESLPSRVSGLAADSPTL